MGNMQEENVQTGTAEKTLDFVKSKYFRDGKEVEEKVYITDSDKLFVVDKAFIDKFYDLMTDVKRLNASNQGLQSQIMNGDLAKHYKVSSKKEAVEKYGEEIIEEYLKKHRNEILEQMRPEIEESFKKDKEAIVNEYLKEHQKTFPYLEKANQKRSEECSYRTACYLADFYSGSSKKEITEKNKVARSTVERLLKLNDETDVNRLMQVYSEYHDLFRGTAESELRSWLEAKLSKKTESLNRKLAEARDFIAKNTPKVDSSGDDWGK